MSEDDIRRYLSSKPVPPPPIPQAPLRPRAPVPKKAEGYEQFSASHLFCPKCNAAMPVRERVMLYLGDSVLYEYRCETCYSSLGTRKA